MNLNEDTCPYICLGRCAQTTLHNTVTIRSHWWSHDISGDLSCDPLSRVGCYKSNTRLYTVYLIKHKSDTFPCFKEYKAWAETRFERKIKVLRDDKGGEYMSNEMAQYLKEHGIQREHMVRATPQQNGAAERGNRVMAEGVTCMLSEAKLPHPSGEKP